MDEVTALDSRNGCPPQTCRSFRMARRLLVGSGFVVAAWLLGGSPANADTSGEAGPDVTAVPALTNTVTGHLDALTTTLAQTPLPAVPVDPSVPVRTVTTGGVTQVLTGGVEVAVPDLNALLPFTDPAQPAPPARRAHPVRPVPQAGTAQPAAAAPFIAADSGSRPARSTVEHRRTVADPASTGTPSRRNDPRPAHGDGPDGVVTQTGSFGSAAALPSGSSPAPAQPRRSRALDRVSAPRGQLAAEPTTSPD